MQYHMTIPVIGYEAKTINTLRLWQAEAIDNLTLTCLMSAILRCC